MNIIQSAEARLIVESSHLERQQISVDFALTAPIPPESKNSQRDPLDIQPTHLG